MSAPIAKQVTCKALYQWYVSNIKIYLIYCSSLLYRLINKVKLP